MCFGSINHCMINRFGRNHLSLFLLLIIYIKFYRVAIVKHNHLMIWFFKNNNQRLAHGIRGTIHMDLIDGFAVLESQIFRQYACFFAAKNQV